MDLVAVRKIDLFGNLWIYAYFYLPKVVVAYYTLPHLWVPNIALYRLSSGVGDKRTRTADILHGVLSWSPILTKNSYGSEGSSYRRTGNREPPFLPDSLVLRMLVLRMSDCPSPTLTALLRTLRMLALRIQLMCSAF
ncbi:hypothetical protein S245_027689 [Arachis hypogaea]